MNSSSYLKGHSKTVCIRWLKCSLLMKKVKVKAKLVATLLKKNSSTVETV
jgi:hypothetical protein